MSKSENEKASQKTSPKICLCSIFRNESKNVYRCLNATKQIVDFISICDTGSTDETKELIHKWGEENNIPTKVHAESFKSFSHNRTVAYQLAKESFPETDYFLLLDADMVLMVGDNFNKNLLDKDSYLVHQGNWMINYLNIRLLSNKKPWQCVLRTHEFWELIPHTAEKLEGTLGKDWLWIDDKEDGGCKMDKFERDYKLLHEEIKDPIREDVLPRCYFYLANTCRTLYHNVVGDKSKDEKYAWESLKWYKKRIDAGGFYDEVYLSKMESGKLYENLGKYEMAAGLHLEAWNTNPARSESLYYLARMYRIMDVKHAFLVYTFSKIGKEIPLPKESLFVEFEIYDYLFDMEIAISSYYIGKTNEGKDAMKRLIKKYGRLNWESKEFVKGNVVHYGLEIPRES